MKNAFYFNVSAIEAVAILANKIFCDPVTRIVTRSRFCIACVYYCYYCYCYLYDIWSSDANTQYVLLYPCVLYGCKV